MPYLHPLRVVRQISQPGCAFLVVHRRGVRISGVHPKIRHSPISPSHHLPVLATRLRNPTVLARLLLCQHSSFLRRLSHDGVDGCSVYIFGEWPLLRGEENLTQMLLEAVL